MKQPAGWWAKGLLFENCNCQLVCPGHVHFQQLCTHERCVGYWAVRFDDGRFEEVSLAGARAVIAYDCPQKMIEGSWTEVVLIDASAGDAQRNAIERILTGQAGGPWEILARFVSNWLPTRSAAIRIEEEERGKSVSIDGILDARIDDIKGRDRSTPVTFENMYNQIHPPTQMLARGTTCYDDGTIRVETKDTHGLYSKFHWRVEG
jgi:hypothetical protein